MLKWHVFVRRTISILYFLMFKRKLCKVKVNQLKILLNSKCWEKVYIKNQENSKSKFRKFKPNLILKDEIKKIPIIQKSKL